jgi:hypothetical protein
MNGTPLSTLPGGGDCPNKMQCWIKALAHSASSTSDLWLFPRACFGVPRGVRTTDARRLSSALATAGTQ